MIVHGVDFSGADDGGTHRIRVASWSLGAPVSITRTDRRSLVRMIQESVPGTEDHLWRIGAASGLPLKTLAAHSVEASWIASARWAKNAGSARAFRTALRQVSRIEPRRRTDYDLRAPLAPMNLRVFKQSWALLCEVLLPLHEAGISIVPVAPTASRVTACEGCPASILYSRGWPAHGYKGQGEPPRRVRAEIVARVVDFGVPVPAPVIEQAIADEHGDLVDALVLLLPQVSSAVPAEALVEGWIY